jgi:hypothetical protein
LWKAFEQQSWPKWRNGTTLVNVSGLSDATSYYIRAIIKEKDGKSNQNNSLPYISLKTTACKREGFIL